MFNVNTLNKFVHLELRTFLAIILSLIIIFFDAKFNMFYQLKNNIKNSIYSFYFVCSKSIHMFDYVLKISKGYEKIILENDRLYQELFLKNNELLLLDQYKKENFKLHKLLNYALNNINKKKLLTKIIFMKINLWDYQIILDQGKNSDVYIGQPVITDTGIVGQIISVNANHSRILLICDPKHALSVKIKRNNVHMILTGRGYNLDLYTEFPENIDVRVGDMLISSGLDGCFPEGYPVAVVSKIQKNDSEDLTIILASSVVEFQSLRYAILLWK